MSVVGELDVWACAALLHRLCRWDARSGRPFSALPGDDSHFQKYARADFKFLCENANVPRTQFRCQEHLRSTLATEFGSRRGWLRAQTPFTPPVLARRGRKRNRRGDYLSPSDPVLDHVYCFRDASGRAAAIVAHPYAPCPPLAGVAAMGCNARVIGAREFPSWHVPPSATREPPFTVAVLLTPKGGQ